jgi:transcription elongation factor GreA
VERVTVVDDIRLAMADKDFRENAPLEAAKEHQGIIEARIRELEASLATAQILGPDSKIVRYRTALGTSVTLKDVSSGKELVYKLVDVREADASSGKISTQSPVGQALLDRAVGDEVTVNVPRGTVQYLVQKIAG